MRTIETEEKSRLAESLAQKIRICTLVNGGTDVHRVPWGSNQAGCGKKPGKGQKWQESIHDPSCRGCLQDWALTELKDGPLAWKALATRVGYYTPTLTTNVIQQMIDKGLIERSAENILSLPGAAPVTPSDEAPVAEPERWDLRKPKPNCWELAELIIELMHQQGSISSEDVSKRVPSMPGFVRTALLELQAAGRIQETDLTYQLLQPERPMLPAVPCVFDGCSGTMERNSLCWWSCSERETHLAWMTELGVVNYRERFVEDQQKKMELMPFLARAQQASAPPVPAAAQPATEHDGYDLSDAVECRNYLSYFAKHDRLMYGLALERVIAARPKGLDKLWDWALQLHADLLDGLEWARLKTVHKEAVKAMAEPSTVPAPGGNITTWTGGDLSAALLHIVGDQNLNAGEIHRAVQAIPLLATVSVEDLNTGLHTLMQMDLIKRDIAKVDGLSYVVFRRSRPLASLDPEQLREQILAAVSERPYWLGTIQSIVERKMGISIDRAELQVRLDIMLAEGLLCSYKHGPGTIEYFPKPVYVEGRPFFQGLRRPAQGKKGAATWDAIEHVVTLEGKVIGSKKKASQLFNWAVVVEVPGAGWHVGTWSAEWYHANAKAEAMHGPYQLVPLFDQVSETITPPAEAEKTITETAKTVTPEPKSEKTVTVWRTFSLMFYQAGRCGENSGSESTSWSWVCHIPTGSAWLLPPGHTWAGKPDRHSVFLGSGLFNSHVTDKALAWLKSLEGQAHAAQLEAA